MRDDSQSEGVYPRLSLLLACLDRIFEEVFFFFFSVCCARAQVAQLDPSGFLFIEG